MKANLAMSFDYREKMHLDPDLHANDISGAIGCIPFPSRTSLLVEATHREFLDDQLWLHCKRFSPEGFGRDFYFQDFVCVPPDTYLDDIVLHWDVLDTIPPHWKSNLVEGSRVFGSWEQSGFSI